MRNTASIVVVEDNPADVFLVRAALEAEGLDFQLQVFSDGEAVLGYLDEIDSGRASCPDLFLLDLNLPKISGQQILQRYQSGIRCVGPVIVMSSSISLQDQESTMKLGAACFFCKPTDLDEFFKLGAVVNKVLQARYC